MHIFLNNFQTKLFNFPHQINHSLQRKNAITKDEKNIFISSRNYETLED